jgi:hypothetical protein
MNRTVLIVVVLVIGYILGAKFPMLATKVGL